MILLRAKGHPLKVEVTSKWFRVRFRDPRAFRTCRQPAWAAKVAGSIAEGARAVQCVRPDRTWTTQSVLVPRRPGRSRADAVRAAPRLYAQIEK